MKKYNSVFDKSLFRFLNSKFLEQKIEVLQWEDAKYQRWCLPASVNSINIKSEIERRNLAQYYFWNLAQY